MKKIYHHGICLYQNHRFIRFLLVGFVNTVFSYLIFALCIFCRVPYYSAVLIATVLSVLFNFMTYGNWVFYYRAPHLLGKFVLAYLIVYGLNVGGLALFSLFRINAYISQAIIVFPLAVCAYFLNRNFVFCRSEHC